MKDYPWSTNMSTPTDPHITDVEEVISDARDAHDTVDPRDADGTAEHTTGAPFPGPWGEGGPIPPALLVILTNLLGKLPPVDFARVADVIDGRNANVVHVERVANGYIVTRHVREAPGKISTAAFHAFVDTITEMAQLGESSTMFVGLGKRLIEIINSNRDAFLVKIRERILIAKNEGEVALAIAELYKD